MWDFFAFAKPQIAVTETAPLRPLPFLIIEDRLILGYKQSSATTRNLSSEEFGDICLSGAVEDALARHNRGRVFSIVYTNFLPLFNIHLLHLTQILKTSEPAVRISTQQESLDHYSMRDRVLFWVWWEPGAQKTALEIIQQHSFRGQNNF